MDKQTAMKSAAHRRLLERARANGIELVEDALDRHARLNGLDRRGLAAWIGCEVIDMARMGLCTLPRRDRFDEDVEAIAAVGRCNSGLLGSVLRAFVSGNRHAMVAEPPPRYLVEPDPPDAGALPDE